MKNTLAYFISPHGFGHAARSVAVMEALQGEIPGIHFHLFTRVPRWFFEKSQIRAFTYHELLTDVGFVQTTTLQEDLPATVKAMENFLGTSKAVIKKCAALLAKHHCQGVITDVSALGIVVAKQACLPSVLIENFTWDWIYQAHQKDLSGFKPIIEHLSAWYNQKTWHIQLTPACAPTKNHLVSRPVSRKPLSSRRQTRNRLGLKLNQKTILLSMGGIPWEYPFLNQLIPQKGLTFLVTGHGERLQKKGSLILIPHRSQFHHPDLLEISDLLVGKLGYSTVAEAYWAGIPFLGTFRPAFRETHRLKKFAADEMGAQFYSPEKFGAGMWIKDIEPMLECGRINRTGENGALQIARFLKEALWSA